MTSRRWILIVIMAVLSLALLVGITVADHNSDYSLDWWSVDGGAANLDGGDFNLAGTIGQPDAGSVEKGDYSLSGGYWTPARYSLYLPILFSD